jgi:D-arabinose 5-phosphate isomerase GutQ
VTPTAHVSAYDPIPIFIQRIVQRRLWIGEGQMAHFLYLFLKVIFFLDIGPAEGYRQGMTHDEIVTTAVRVWETAAKEISGLTSSVNREALGRCVGAIAGCRGRIVTIGCGTSAVAARKLAHSLSCIEQPAFFLSPADAPHGTLGAVHQEDLVVLVSKGGGTSELISLLQSLKKKKVFIVTVTENEDAPLSQASDLVLRVKVEKEADPFNLLATTSTMAVIAVFDAICIALMEYTGYTREQFSVIHPHGAVGEKLTGKDS